MEYFFLQKSVFLLFSWSKTTNPDIYLIHSTTANPPKVKIALILGVNFAEIPQLGTFQFPYSWHGWAHLNIYDMDGHVTYLSSQWTLSRPWRGRGRWPRSPPPSPAWSSHNQGDLGKITSVVDPDQDWHHFCLLAPTRIRVIEKSFFLTFF